MGCGSSAPEVNETTATQNKRERGEKQENIKIEVSEDPDMQGEKFHENNGGGEEEGEESGDNENNGEKDSFDDF